MGGIRCMHEIVGKRVKILVGNFERKRQLGRFSRGLKLVLKQIEKELCFRV
jgi:hypothetical protein